MVTCGMLPRWCLLERKRRYLGNVGNKGKIGNGVSSDHGTAPSYMRARDPKLKYQSWFLLFTFIDDCLRMHCRQPAPEAGYLGCRRHFHA
jgi:hypothetical protein